MTVHCKGNYYISWDLLVFGTVMEHKKESLSRPLIFSIGNTHFKSWGKAHRRINLHILSKIQGLVKVYTNSCRCFRETGGVYNSSIQQKMNYRPNIIINDALHINIIP